MPLTFEQSKDTFEFVKDIVEFVVEVVALLYGLWYHFDVIRSWLDIGRGCATGAQKTLATQTWTNATPSTQIIIDRALKELERHGHREEAERIREVATEAQNRLA